MSMGYRKSEKRMKTPAEMEQTAKSWDNAACLQILREIRQGGDFSDWGGAGKALEYLMIRAFERELGSSNPALQRMAWPYKVTSDMIRVGITEQLDGVR